MLDNAARIKKTIEEQETNKIDRGLDKKEITNHHNLIVKMIDSHIKEEDQMIEEDLMIEVSIKIEGDMMIEDGQMIETRVVGNGKIEKTDRIDK